MVFDGNFCEVPLILEKGESNMKLYLRLAWRNVWRHRRRTIIIVAAMGFTLAMMMMYDGLVSGFNQAIYGNAIKVLGGNIQVHAPGYEAETGMTPLLPLPNDTAVVQAAEADSRVEAALRRIITGGLVTSPEGAFGISIIGIEPGKEAQTNLAAQNITAGRFLQEGDMDVVLIGKGLADATGVQVGDRITMTGRAAHEQMRSRTMTVAGIFDLGIPDIEKQMVYVTLPEAQDLYNLKDQSTEVSIVLKQIGEEKPVITSLKTSLPDYDMKSYNESYPELAQALATKGAAMNVFSVIIMLIAGIGILNLLLMAVYERTREIGVLGALGFKPGQISLLFILEGTLIGLVGVAAGIVMGLIFNGLIRMVGLDYTSFSGMTSYTALITGRVYPSWGMEKIIGRALAVAVIAALSALIPAREAAGHDPAQALHFM
jgi:ABC-type lipoprotein release transport system permease subunit